MSTFFNSIEPPQSNQNSSNLPAQNTGGVPGVPSSSHGPVHHSSFQPNYGFYALTGFLLLLAILLLYLLADWSLGRICWGTLLPVIIGIVTYRFIEPPYRDSRARQVAGIIGFGFMGLLLIIYHLLLPLLSSNHPVHLYLLALIAALGLVTWFLYQDQQLYRAIGTGLVGVFLLIGTLSFWHLWSGQFAGESGDVSWTRYSIFAEEPPQPRKSEAYTPPSSPQPLELEQEQSTTLSAPRLQSFDAKRGIAKVVTTKGEIQTKLVGQIFSIDHSIWVINTDGYLQCVLPYHKSHSRENPRLKSYDRLERKAQIIMPNGAEKTFTVGQAISDQDKYWIVDWSGKLKATYPPRVSGQ